MTTEIKSEERPEYLATKDGDAIIKEALSILENRLHQPGEAITSPQSANNFLILKLAEKEHEVFACLFLGNRHRVIAFEEMFHGTIDGANVYPREVVKAALRHNAAAVILSHNHPSGVAEPSSADQSITAKLKDALSLVDVRVLDHIIVGGTTTVSLAERGLI